MNEWAKMIVSATVWTMCGAICIAILLAPNPEEWVIVFPLMAAVIVTLSLWSGDAATDAMRAQISGVEAIEKSKRDPDAKMRLLLEMMDDDERVAFKETLKRQVLQNARYEDGELGDSGLSLESLLGEQDQQRRR